VKRGYADAQTYTYKERGRENTIAKKTYRSFVKEYLSCANQGELVLDITILSL
jgi:hypothetical protein